MVPPIFAQLDGRISIYRHEHVAVLRRGQAEALRVAQFLSEGLRSGDRCYYLAPAAFRPAMLEQLRKSGTDPESHEREGTLRFQPPTSDFHALQSWIQEVFGGIGFAPVPAIRWV